jgi:hypothetical protein
MPKRVLPTIHNTGPSQWKLYPLVYFLIEKATRILYYVVFQILKQKLNVHPEFIILTLNVQQLFH